MLHPDAQLWNARYLADQKHYLRRQPYRLVRSFADRLPKGGLALEVASGASPAGIYLAGKGLRVVAMDVSEAGLRLGQQRARELSLPLIFVVMDLTDPWLPSDCFDVILNFYYLSRPLFECYRKALKPGGWLFFETFVQDINKRCNSNHYLESGELFSAFQDWEILQRTETWKNPRGNVLSTERIAQLVARKPYLEERNLK